MGRRFCTSWLATWKIDFWGMIIGDEWNRVYLGGDEAFRLGFGDEIGILCVYFFMLIACLIVLVFKFFVVFFRSVFFFRLPDPIGLHLGIVWLRNKLIVCCCAGRVPGPGVSLHKVLGSQFLFISPSKLSNSRPLFVFNPSEPIKSGVFPGHMVTGIVFLAVLAITSLPRSLAPFWVLHYS